MMFLEHVQLQHLLVRKQIAIFRVTLVLNPNAFGSPAIVPGMWAARQPIWLFHFQGSNVLLKKCFPERTPNRRQITPYGTQMSEK